MLNYNIARFLKKHVVGMFIFAVLTGVVANYLYGLLSDDEDTRSVRLLAVDSPVIEKLRSVMNTTFESGGMTGVMIEIGDCYGSLFELSPEEDVRFCFYLDLIAAHFDNEAAKTFGWPRNEYLEFSQSLERLAAAFKKTNLPTWKLNDSVRAWNADVEKVLIPAIGDACPQERN